MTLKQKRTEIKRILPKLTEGNYSVFMKMHSPFALEKDINEGVDELPVRKLNVAIQQVNNTYYRIFRILKSA